MQTFEEVFVIGFAVITVLAVVCSIITNMIKELVFIDKIPTSIVCMVVSLLVCLFMVQFAYTYMDFGISRFNATVFAIIGSFVVSLVSMSGWDRINQIIESICSRKDMENLLDTIKKYGKDDK